MTKTILITGSTDGIGLLAAKTLVERGHSIILHGRNASKLVKASNKMHGDAPTYQADLSSVQATKQLARDIQANHDKIDVLINNA